MTPATSSLEWEIQLMKFADHELINSEEVDVLAQCEIEPQRYRDLALALVEQRRLVTALAPSAAQPRSGARPSSPRRISNWALTTAAAVMLVVGAAAGSFYERGRHAASAGSGVEEQGNTFVVFQSGGESRPPATEFYPQAEELVAQSLRSWFHPLEREALRRHGYELREEPKLYVFTDDQGNEAAVPQRQLQITKVSN
ncbi:MAG: hypothetical protein ACR2NU_06640 [Aeoliella sp.]